MAMRSLRLMLPLGALAAAGLGAAALAQTEALETLNVRETVLSAEQGRNQNRLARLLTALMQLRRDPPPALLVRPDDAVDAVRAAILVKAVTPELQARAQAYAAQAAEIARQRRLAAVASEALFLDDSRSAETRGQASETPPPLEPPTAAPERLLPPVTGPVTRAFGTLLPSGSEARGLTFQAAKGATVRAPSAGSVEFVGPVKGWGVILILRLTGGYHLVLGGLDRTSASVGQSVAAGTAVGWMPNGKNSPSELYLEIRERGEPVDPGRWLAGAG
jgi:murein hydrolase activator